MHVPRPISVLLRTLDLTSSFFVRNSMRWSCFARRELGWIWPPVMPDLRDCSFLSVWTLFPGIAGGWCA